MKVAIFSTKSYDREYFDKFNIEGKHKHTYFDAALNCNTTN
jgi:D-lactate dehydrogenase